MNLIILASALGLCFSFFSELGMIKVLGVGEKSDTLLLMLSVFLFFDTILREGIRYVFIRDFSVDESRFYSIVHLLTLWGSKLLRFSCFILPIYFSLHYFHERSLNPYFYYLVLVFFGVFISCNVYVYAAWLDAHGEHFLPSLRGVIPPLVTLLVGVPLLYFTLIPEVYFLAFVVSLYLLVILFRRKVPCSDDESKYSCNELNFGDVKKTVGALAILQAVRLCERYFLFTLDDGFLTVFVIVFKVYSSIQTVFSSSISPLLIRRSLSSRGVFYKDARVLFLFSVAVAAVFYFSFAYIPYSILVFFGFENFKDLIMVFATVFTFLIPFNNISPVFSGYIIANKKVMFFLKGSFFQAVARLLVLISLSSLGVWAVLFDIVIGVYISFFLMLYGVVRVVRNA